MRKPRNPARTVPVVRQLVSVAAGALVIGAAAPAGAEAADDCPSLKPRNVQLTSNRAGDRITITWGQPRKRPANLAFRVARDGAVVGHTSGRRMAVRVSPNRPARITVTAVVGGRVTSCRVAVGFIASGGGRGAPGRVKGLSAAPHGPKKVKLTWDAAKPGGRPLAGYRLLRGGKVVRRTTRRAFTVRMTRRTQRYRVVAYDTSGRPGPRSRVVKVRKGQARPSRPTGLVASDVGPTSVTLSWAKSRAFRGRIAEYWVRSGGRTIRVVKRPRVRLNRLKTNQQQTFRVVAIDSSGWRSKYSQPVKVTTGHVPPSAPGAPKATEVTDTTVTLTWPAAALPKGSQLRGYRVMRDGAVVTQVPGEQVTVGNLAPKSGHDWTVAAVDTRGYVSAPSPATRVVQADPPPSTGEVQTFLLASTDASFAAFRKHYRQISVVYPTFYDCDGSGKLIGRNDELIVRFAQDRKVKVLPRFNCQRTAVLHRILTEPALRQSWLDSMAALAVQHGWDGINVDFEAIPAEDRDLMTSFIADLSEMLHGRGKLLSQAVSAKSADSLTHPRSGAFDYPELAKYNDYVFVMAWGVHWATSAPGPQDDYPWVRAVHDYVATMPYKEKWVMGTMLYGMDWPAGGGPSNPGTALHYSEIQALISRTGATPVFDETRRSWHLAYADSAGVAHDLWYSDAPAVGDRVALARERGMKVGFWRIGQEDERIWADARLASTP